MLNPFCKKKKEPQNLKEILDLISRLDKESKQINQELQNLRKNSQKFVQGVGMIRFNPFQEVGGDQSFAVALLDADDNGLVITSLYSREGNRIYAKPINGGVSPYPLSEEEKKAIDQARKNRPALPKL